MSKHAHLTLICPLVLIGSQLLPAPASASPGRGLPRSPAPRQSTAASRAVTDTWTTIVPGVRHLHRTTSEPLSAHVLVVDLRAPGVVVEVTPHGQRWMKPSQFGKVSGAVAAINGGFWSVFDQKAEGLVMHGGLRWPGSADDEFYGFFAIDRLGRGLISTPSNVVTKVNNLREAISGRQLILDRGKTTRGARCPDGCRYRQPRTAVGVGAGGRTVYLAVVDGRQAHSRGISLLRLARLLSSLGADRAINLDGGGSAAMYLTTRKGLVNRPADRREREVLNHIGVFWRPTRQQLAAARAAAARAAAARAPSRAGGGSASGARSESGAPVANDPTAPTLLNPPRPTTAGVPTGLRRLWQRSWREVFSPRHLLLATPVIFGLFLLGVWVARRIRSTPPS